MAKTDEFKTIFGQHLKNLRKARNLTQAQLAEKVSVEPKHISCIENGQSFPSGDLIARLASAFNFHCYELFLFEQKPSVNELKKEILSIIDTTTDENVEKIYLYAKFVTSEKNLDCDVKN